MGVKISKRYSSYKLQRKVFKHIITVKIVINCVKMLF